MTAQPNQATVHEFDPRTGAGSVITDQGLVIPFAAAAWGSGTLRSGALRSMRLGQRVLIDVAGSGSDATVTALTLVTFPPPS